jgi:hypothetical protein
MIIVGIRAMSQNAEAINSHVEPNTVRHRRKEERGAMLERHPLRPRRGERAAETSTTVNRPSRRCRPDDRLQSCPKLAPLIV